MPGFTDNRGIVFTFDIKTKDAILIKNLLKDDEGKPLDLLALADQGEMWKVYGSVQRMLDVTFLCCLDFCRENWNEAEFDREHEIELETMPELRRSKFEKIRLWFSEGIGPEQITQMVPAFREAISNFIPNPYQRKLLARVLENVDALEQAKMERAMKVSDARLAKAKEFLETSEALPEELGEIPGQKP